jgi:hypothetical protein
MLKTPADGAQRQQRRAVPLSPTLPKELHLSGRSRLEQECAMCRNIRTLFNFEPPATDEEVRAAAEQFVRKIDQRLHAAVEDQ